VLILNITTERNKVFAYWKDELSFYWKSDKLRSWDTFLRESSIEWQNWNSGGTK
jgi:hypothetical protein